MVPEGGILDLRGTTFNRPRKNFPTFFIESLIFMALDSAGIQFSVVDQLYQSSQII